MEGADKWLILVPCKVTALIIYNTGSRHGWLTLTLRGPHVPPPVYTLPVGVGLHFLHTFSYCRFATHISMLSSLLAHMYKHHAIALRRLKWPWSRLTTVLEEQTSFINPLRDRQCIFVILDEHILVYYTAILYSTKTLFTKHTKEEEDNCFRRNGNSSWVQGQIQSQIFRGSNRRELVAWMCSTFTNLSNDNKWRMNLLTWLIKRGF